MAALRSLLDSFIFMLKYHRDGNLFNSLRDCSFVGALIIYVASHDFVLFVLHFVCLYKRHLSFVSLVSIDKV